MTDSSNLIDLASEINEDNNIILPLVPSPTIKLYIDKNNPFDIVAEEVDIKNANADDPFEFCFDDAFKTENNGVDIFPNDISHINSDISFENDISPIKEKHKSIFESSRIQNHLVELNDDKIKHNIKENDINKPKNDISFKILKNSSINVQDEQMTNTNLLELDNLQASLLDFHEMDSLKINDNLFSQDEESLLNKLQINDNSGSNKTFSNENSLSDKIDFLNTSVDDLKALVAKRIDKCIKSGLNESKTNLNFSNIETKKDANASLVRTMNRAYSESSCLNKLNMSKVEFSKEKDVTDFTHHFKSKAFSDLTRDLISLKNFRRSSTSASLSNSFTQSKENAKTNSFFGDPTSTHCGKKICDEEEPEWLSNSFESSQNENMMKNQENIYKSPKISLNDKRISEKENKIELKTKIGENDIVIIVTPSCKSNSKNLQESLVPHVTETLNSFFGKNNIKSQENNPLYMTGKSNTKIDHRKEKQVSDTPTSIAPSKLQNRLGRLKKNIANSLNKGPLKATMPVQQMAKECRDQDDKPLPSNYPITPITKKDSNLKPKATSTPLSSLASRGLSSQSFNKKPIKPSPKGPVTKVFNRSLTESPVSPSVPLMRRSNSMTSPQKVTDLYRSKKTNISKNTKLSSPSIKKSPKSTSPLQPKQNLMKSQSHTVTKKMETKTFFGKVRK